MPHWMRWADELVSLSQVARTTEELSALLAEWGQRADQDVDVAGSLYRANLTADMGGQLFVRLVEVPEATGQIVDLAEDERPSFLRMEFREAIEAFMRRRIVTPQVFAAMTKLARLRAFTATHLASDGLIARAYELLRLTLENGGTLRDFQRALTTESFGITPAAPHYIETVYRTNVQMAYGQGRLTQLEHPDVLAARPLVQYRTSRDTRVRPAHAALDGLVFDRSDDSGWRRYAPPLGYNCRCSMIAVREDRIGDGRRIRSEELDPNVGPDPQWAGPGTAGPRPPVS